MQSVWSIVVTRTVKTQQQLQQISLFACEQLLLLPQILCIHAQRMKYLHQPYQDENKRISTSNRTPNQHNKKRNHLTCKHILYFDDYYDLIRLKLACFQFQGKTH